MFGVLFFYLGMESINRSFNYDFYEFMDIFVINSLSKFKPS
jgi:hypothetical protein